MTPQSFDRVDFTTIRCIEDKFDVQFLTSLSNCFCSVYTKVIYDHIFLRIRVVKSFSNTPEESNEIKLVDWFLSSQSLYDFSSTVDGPYNSHSSKWDPIPRFHENYSLLWTSPHFPFSLMRRVDGFISKQNIVWLTLNQVCYSFVSTQSARFLIVKLLLRQHDASLELAVPDASLFINFAQVTQRYWMVRESSFEK